MNDPARTFGPAALAARMAELDHRLRHAASGGDGRLSPPLSLGRIEVACRLLGTCEARDPGGRWTALARAASSFCDAARRNPDRLPAAWDPLLRRLADSLEMFLDELDEGAGPQEVARAPVWSDLLRVEPPVEPAAAPREPGSAAADWRHPRRRYALLLSSSFQRDQISARLEAAAPYLARSPEEVREWLLDGPADSIVLADNLEPDRHLDALLERLSVEPDLRPERCLHVAGALGGGSRRVRAPGIDGIWSPPYSLEDLDRFLAG